MGQTTIDGATPLEPDEAEGLLPEHVGTKEELNEWEQANIATAVFWIGERRSKSSVLSLEFIRELHRRMFDETWRWAGKYRTTNKNIGVSAPAIPESLGNLLEDTKHWIEHGTFPLDEIAVRFHHRLVQIHPFPNGNGRHGRLMTDALLEELGVAPFTWGSANLVVPGNARRSYLKALRSADRGDYTHLMSFVHS